MTERSAEDTEKGAPVDDRLLAMALVEFADTLVDEFDLAEFLQGVTERTVELLGVDVAGILLAGPTGRLGLVAASAEEARFLETIQLQKDEGPCLEVFETKDRVICPDLADDARWPRFTRVAIGAGFRAAYAFPMRLRDKVIGGMNLFCARPTRLSEDTMRYAQALADVTAIGILSDRAMRQNGIMAEDLQRALNDRVALEQAKGFLSERLGVSLGEASDRIRVHAREGGLKVADVARAVLNRDPSIQALDDRPTG